MQSSSPPAVDFLHRPFVTHGGCCTHLNGDGDGDGDGDEDSSGSLDTVPRSARLANRSFQPLFWAPNWTTILVGRILPGAVGQWDSGTLGVCLLCLRSEE
jgi:hypothetical protein